MLKMRMFVLFLAPLMFFAQAKKVKVNLSSPYHTVYTHLYFLQEESYKPQKSAKTIYGFRGEKAAEIAIKIKEILDGKGLKVDPSKISQNTNYLDTISGFEMKYRYVLFPKELPEIYLERYNGLWMYSEETCENIDALYLKVFPKVTTYLKKIIPNKGHIKFLSIELWQYVGIGLLLVLSYLLYLLAIKVVYLVTIKSEKLFIKYSSHDLNVSIDRFSRPVALLIVFYAIEQYIPVLLLGIDINSFLIKGLEIAQTILWIYVFIKMVDMLIHVFSIYADRTESKLDDQLAPILKRLLKAIVIILGILKLFTVFGVDTTTVLAGASIGGLAVALASQDTVKNLIGTLMIFLDKPFQIGDWIQGGGVEGVVEEVGFRSSRIRAADTSIFTIPNSMLSEIVINNKGLRKYRRYQTVLGIRYDTPPELVEVFVEGVRKLIEKHPETLTENYNVELAGFGSYSLDIMVNTYFVSLDWSIEQTSKHKLHMQIIRLAKALGVQFAYPSQTLYVEEFPEKKSKIIHYQVSSEDLDEILEKL